VTHDSALVSSTIRPAAHNDSLRKEKALEPATTPVA
jgi:hypothetical protein